MTEHDVLCSAIATLGVGGETVGSVLQAFFYLLLKEDPVHLQRLRDEIDNPKALKLPYLQACVSPIIPPLIHSSIHPTATDQNVTPHRSKKPSVCTPVYHGTSPG